MNIAKVYGRLWVLSLCLGILSVTACNDNQLGPSPTEVGRGGLSGRVCSPNGANWIFEATVYIPIYDDAGNVVLQPETKTDLDGYFTLTDIPEGTWILHVVKNSFSTEEEIVIVAGEVTVMAEPTCVDPYSARVAVVTGLYDRVEDVIQRVGLTDVTMFDGVNDTGQSATSLLTDLTVMTGFDIIFLNCGMVENGLISNPTVINNLRAFVDAGGSLYVSDWAYDYIEIGWPSAIEFWGDDSTPNSAAFGLDGFLTGQIADSALSSVLGGSTVTLNYDLGAWIVTEGVGPGTRVLVSGPAPALDVSNPYNPQVVTVNNAPLMVQFEHGQGKVMYTTFHNEAQTTGDMDIILEFMVFEL